MGRKGERGPGVGLLVGAVIAILLLCAISVAHRAYAQDHTQGHMRYHAQYMFWKQPGSEASCCNARVTYPNGTYTGDCFPTPFRLIGGHWQALKAPEDGGEWVDVPDAKIIREHNPDPSGVTGHLCWSQYAGVLCAVPPTGAL
jgi:hypothetical protein